MRKLLASCGISFVLLLAPWSGPTSSGVARAAQPTGATVGPELPLSDPAYVQGAADSQYEGPAVAWGNTEYLVAWADFGVVRAIRVAADGTILDDLGISITGNLADEPVVAFDGSDFVLAWTEGNFPVEEIHAARVSQDGTVLDDPSLVLGDAGGYPYPRIASNGSNSLVVWGNGALTGARIGLDGTVLDPGGFPIGGEGDGTPDVATVGTRTDSSSPTLPASSASRPWRRTVRHTSSRGRTNGPDPTTTSTPRG
jgi:hypothetical protein